MTIVTMRRELSERGLPGRGLRAEVENRLVDAMTDEANGAIDDNVATLLDEPWDSDFDGQGGLSVSQRRSLPSPRCTTAFC